jgi:hypothetical protein
MGEAELQFRHSWPRVCRLQLLLALARAVIVGSESRGTCEHILLSQIRDFPFRRLLPLAWLRWRHSTPPPHGKDLCKLKVTLESITCPSVITSSWTECRSPSQTVSLFLSVFCLLLRNVCQSRGNALITTSVFVAADTRFSEPLSSNGLFRIYSLPRERVLIS